MHATHRVERNLGLVPAYQALAFGYAVIPFFILLVREQGLSFADYASLQSVYYITTLLCDLPTGILADWIGRKPVLALAAVAQSAGFVAMALAQSYGAFACAQILLGLGQAMLSGTTAAIVYDSLRITGRTQEYVYYESLSVIGRMLGTSVAFLAGGYISQYYSFEAAAWTSGILTLLSLPVALVMTEPPHGDARRRAVSLAGLVRSSATDLWSSRDLMWIAILFASFFVASRIAFSFYTPALQHAGIESPFAIGVVYSVLNVIAAVATRLAPRLASVAGERKPLLSLLLLFTVSFAIHAFTDSPAAVVLVFVLQQVPFGLHFPLVSAFVNKRVPVERRATFLSVLSLLGRLAFATTFPLFGFLAGRSLPASMALAAGVFLILAFSLGHRRFQPRNESPGTSTPDP